MRGSKHREQRNGRWVKAIMIFGVSVVVICTMHPFDDLSATTTDLFAGCNRIAAIADVDLAAITLAGFAAQLVDGSLGMGYGMTSATVLVSVGGLSPVTASTSVHLAQLGTTALSGLAHHRYGNVDHSVAVQVASSGAAGGFLGSLLLSTLPTAAAKPIASGLLFTLGVYVLTRFYVSNAHCVRNGQPAKALLLPLGFIGGFVDATGGGGWGPVATSGLLADGRLHPSRVIGTVSLSEFFVTVAAVGGFLASSVLGLAGDAEGENVRADIVLTLLVGGMMAAPVAPILVGKLKPQLLGVVVGGFICFSNCRGLLRAAGVSPRGSCCFYAVLLIVWGAAVADVARRRSR
jgi:uncharacterized membrane protein YfcA